MPIQIVCPACTKSLKAPESMAGKVAKCPSCGNEMTVPVVVPEVHEAEPVSAEVNPYNLSEPPRDIGGAAFGGQSVLLSQPAGSAAADEPPRRPCPACGELIVAGAAKCRFCGEIFDETLRSQSFDPAKIKKFRSEVHAVGGFWIFIGLVVFGLGIAVMNRAMPGVVEGMAFVFIGLGATWFVLGIFTCLKHLWALYLGLVMSYLSLLGNIVTAFQQGTPPNIIAMVLLLLVIVQAHRSISTAHKMRQAGIPLTTKPAKA